MSNIHITDHAYDRAKERLGLNKKAVDRLVPKALAAGIAHGETNGNLHKYISSKAQACMRKGLDIRIHGEIIYFFVRHGSKGSPETQYNLVTVYGLPNNLKESAVKAQKRKKKQ